MAITVMTNHKYIYLYEQPYRYTCWSIYNTIASRNPKLAIGHGLVTDLPSFVGS
jgi:hypothetical protein